MQNKLLRIFIPQTLPLRGEYSLDALVVNGDAQCPVSLIVKPDAISRLNAGHEAQLKLFTENSSASQACAHVRLEATCCTDCKVKCAGVNLRTEYSDFAQSQVILFTPTGFGSHYNYARASAGTTAGCNWDKILYLLNQTEAPTTTQYRQLIWRLVTLDRIAGNAKCISCSWQHMKRRRARLTGIAVSIKARATQNDVAGKNQRVVREWQEITAAIQYHAMGCCCGVLLLQHSIVCCQGMEHAASWLSHHAVHGSLMWLMGAPAGLKLHSDLSHVLGSVGLWWLHHVRAVFVMLVKPALPALLGVAAVAGIVGGLPMLLAFLQDLLSLVAIPITLAYMCYLRLYRLQLHCISVTWRLMRGNRDVLSSLRRYYGYHSSPRKQQQDAAQNELCLEQMIVGVLLFTPLLLLLPTTLVYYVLALVLHLTIFFAHQAMSLTAELLHLSPAYLVWCWAFQPGSMSGSVAFVPAQQQYKLNTARGPCPTVTLTMKSIPRSLQAEIASACSDALQVLSIDKQLLNSMLAGGPIGCKYVEVQLELIQQYIAERAYSTVSRLQSSCLPHLQGLWNRVANLYLLTW